MQQPLSGKIRSERGVHCDSAEIRRKPPCYSLERVLTQSHACGRLT